MAFHNHTHVEKERPRIHASIVPDGNRRYAKACGKPYYEGYLDGVMVLDNLIDAIGASKVDDLLFRIRMVTVFVCSIDNIKKRPQEEIEKLFSLFRLYFGKYNASNSILHQHRIKVRIVGKLSLFPQDLQETFASIVRSTADYDKYVLNLACAYDGRTEIMDAVSKREQSDNKSESLQPYLYVSDDIDLVVRTGKERRTSGFFPWITTYSEWFFIDLMWPEFTIDKFREILVEFDTRQRRFGA